MSFACTHCGETHEGLPAWVAAKPDPWFGLTEDEQRRAKCDENLCDTRDGHFFVRAVLQLPLVEGPEPSFEFGVWGSLSEDNFKRYTENFQRRDRSKLGWMFSYLSNELPGFPGTRGLKAHLHPQDDLQRPLMELEPTDHPLAIAQREGIPFAKALEIIHPDESKP